MDREHLDRICHDVSAAIAHLALECIEAQWLAHSSTLQVFIDDPTRERTINIDDCASVSRALDGLAALEEQIPGRFHLEVSSPGVERPLRFRKDFERFLSAELSVQLFEKWEDRRKGRGPLLEVRDGEAGESLATLKTEQGPWTFPLSRIQKAHLVFDWDA